MESIPKVLDILGKNYNTKERTTLNRMRTKPKPFKVLIACLLSLRAKDETTDVISRELFKIANTPEKIAKMPTRKLEKIIFSTGHYHKKARVLKSVSEELIGRFDSKVPRTREELMTIKGVGPKTANIVLNFAFGENVIPVDTHVHRVSNRLGWVSTKVAEKTEVELMKVVPKKYWSEINALLVLFGRDICQPISPWCSKCPIAKSCEKVGVVRSR